MNRRWINTKVEFIWDGTQYVEQSAEGYWYDGEMAMMATHDSAVTIDAQSSSSPFSVTTTGHCNLTFENSVGNHTNLNLQNNQGGTYGSNTTVGVALNRGGAGTVGSISTGEARYRDLYWDGSSGTKIENQFRIQGGTSSTTEPDIVFCTGAPAAVSGDAVQARRMVIKYSGRVGIGTVTPANPFHVQVSNNADMAAKIENTHETAGHGLKVIAGDSSSENILVCASQAGTDMLYVKGNGDVWVSGSVGIGDSSPSYKLEVAGSFYSSGSSVDFKKHVTDMAIDSSAIYDLNPVSYEYKKDYENFGYDLAGGKQVGLLSEDVAKTVPELAIMKDGKAQNVDYQKLSVLLLAEMKKLNKRIETLEAQ